MSSRGGLAGPPAEFLLGGLAASVGLRRSSEARGETAPGLAENLVFVPLLALACYRVGRMVAGGFAGLRAVLFALGTPLLIEQLHVFLLDAPQAALAAVAV